MAEVISCNYDLFTCPICLDLLRDPVTIPCGHNYCMDCITCCWDQGDQRGVYSCPQCRQDFTPKPVLNKNNIIAQLVERTRKTRFQWTPPCYAELEDVCCDVCTGRKLKAVTSCLDCLVSYCEYHSKVHNDLHPEQSHKMIDATSQLQDRICIQHEKPLEIFCCTDNSCVCFLCILDGHRGHTMMAASAVRREKETHLCNTQWRFKQRIQEREMDLQKLRMAVETLKSSAQTAVEDSEKIFAEMIRSIEKRRSEVTELIRAHEKAEVSRAEGVLKRLEQEIAKMKKRDAELEQLLYTEDHIYFLKTFQAVNDQLESKDSSSIYLSPKISFEAVNKSVSNLEEQLENSWKNYVMKISEAVTKVQVVLPEPSTRDDFLQYSCHFTLDPNTAYRHLCLSEGNRRVEGSKKVHLRPDHPDRFYWWSQVLCREGVSERCYWELEWSGVCVYIAVSYKPINTKGRHYERKFGCSDQSWRIRLTNSSSTLWHNNEETKLPLVASSRIGVYVDHRAGTLAFYNISDTMTLTLLHSLQTTFTQPLYPGLWLCTKSSVKLL